MPRVVRDGRSPLSLDHDPAFTFRCEAKANPSLVHTDHAGWAEVHSARSPSSQTLLPALLSAACPWGAMSIGVLSACLAVFHIAVLPLLIFAVLALLSACTEANGRHDVSSTIAFAGTTRSALVATLRTVAFFSAVHCTLTVRTTRTYGSISSVSSGVVTKSHVSRTS